MGFLDLVLGPIYFLLIFYWAKSYSAKFNDPFLSKHFLNGLLFKLLGATGASVIYWFVYGTGDSIFYYRRSIVVKEVLMNDFFVGLKLLFDNTNLSDPDTFLYIISIKAHEESAFMVVKILTFINLITFDSYLCSSYIFALGSFYGIWKAFRFFVSLYPKYKSNIALSFFYIPSVAFWGSGIFKDNITFGLLCLVIVKLYDVVVNRKLSILNFVKLGFSIYIIGIIKSYILMAFLPAFGVWMFLEFRDKIRSAVLKTVATPFFIAISLVAGVFVLQVLGKTFNKFSVENFEEKASGMQRWHTNRVKARGEGSSYTLGDGVDFTPVGIAKKAPLAIAVAIYRPFIWEARNATMMLSAIESTILLYYTLRFLPFLLVSPVRFFSVLSSNPPLVFALIFSLVFAFSVGFTSFNFGALSRYRIPFLPLYFMFITIVLDKLKTSK
jgi:hypothetical protein